MRPGETHTESGLDGVLRELAFKSQLLDASLDAIVACNLDGRIAYANEAACDVLGYPLDELAALPPWGWLAPDSRRGIFDRVDQIRYAGGLSFCANGLKKDGRVTKTEVHARISETVYGELVIAVLRDITDRVEAEEAMRYLAFHDELTGVANRKAFVDKLACALANADRHADIVGVVYLDLDDFKPVNDTLGHAMGDKVLQVVARRMQACVRECDTVARIGGDEFMVLFDRLVRREDLAVAAKKLGGALSRPIRVDGHTVRVTASAGLALYEPGEEADELVTRADHAMYRAKQNDLPGWESFLGES
jgi:diguanylate cyclase (GGDEF)-like protein/PAS domain S-box-containing protein